MFYIYSVEKNAYLIKKKIISHQNSFLLISVLPTSRALQVLILQSCGSTLLGSGTLSGTIVLHIVSTVSSTNTANWSEKIIYSVLRGRKKERFDYLFISEI